MVSAPDWRAANAAPRMARLSLSDPQEVNMAPLWVGNSESELRSREHFPSPIQLVDQKYGSMMDCRIVR